MAKEPRYVKLTLEWCNRQRKKKGKKPLKRLPRGEWDDPISCPCGTATGLYVGKTDFYELVQDHMPDQRTKKKLPKPVIKFVFAFDNGELPQYLVGGAKRIKCMED